MTFNHKLPFYVGAEGVHITESSRARNIGLMFEVPMLVAAIWVLLNWWAETALPEKNIVPPIFEQLLWGFFIIETLVLSQIVENKRRYLRGNWLNLVIITFGIMQVLGYDFNVTGLRILRLLTISALASHVGMALHRLLRRNKLGTTLMATFVFIVVAGIMSATLDPGIKTPIDGIWWAWVTVTSVGYGDIVPVSNVGKVFASLLILMGLFMMALITATFTASFVEEDKKDRTSKENILEKRIKRLEARFDHIDVKINLVLHNLNIPLPEQNTTLEDLKGDQT